jgi:hypothetical protein
MADVEIMLAEAGVRGLEFRVRFERTLPGSFGRGGIVQLLPKGGVLGAGGGLGGSLPDAARR